MHFTRASGGSKELFGELDALGQEAGAILVARLVPVEQHPGVPAESLRLGHDIRKLVRLTERSLEVALSVVP